MPSSATTRSCATCATTRTLCGSEPVWVIAAANLCYPISIALPSIAVWLHKDALELARPYRAWRGTIVLGLIATRGPLTIVGLERFGLPTVLASMALADSGPVLYAWRHQSAGRPERGGNPAGGAHHRGRRCLWRHDDRSPVPARP
jgi:hypothetical protein